MEKLNYHKDNAYKTKLELEIDKFMGELSGYDVEKLKKELEKVNKKLVVPYANVDTGIVTEVDIKDDVEEKNRLYMRKVLCNTAKWIGFTIKKSGRDYAMIWNLINSTFSSRQVGPEFDNERVALGENIAFMDTLSLDGLRMYKKFLVSVANSVLYEGKCFEEATLQAQRLIKDLNDFYSDIYYYDDKVLPKNWQKYYKYTMKQKAILVNIKIKTNDEVLSK